MIKNNSKFSVLFTFPPTVRYLLKYFNVYEATVKLEGLQSYVIVWVPLSTDDDDSLN